MGKHGGKRAGAGRPPVLRSPTLIVLRLEERDAARLAAAAEKRGATVSELLRSLIRRFLR